MTDPAPRLPAPAWKNLMGENNRIFYFYSPVSQKHSGSGPPQNEVRTLRQPIIHFISPTSTYSRRGSRGSKKKKKEVQFECDRCGSFVLMCVLCGSFRRRGDRDEGGPGAVQHAAWEGVWRAGYSLQLHQDGHCQE